MPARGQAVAKKKKKTFQIELGCKENFQYWSDKLQSFAYSRGKSYLKLYKQGMEGKAEDDENPDDDDTEERREMWGAIYDTLSKEEVKVIRTIKLGAVEKILRAIKKLYEPKTDTDLDKHRSLLENTKLMNFPSLNAYITFFETLHTRMEDYKEPLTLGNKKYYLYKGLPADYGQAITALRLPGSNYGWEEVKDFLREFCETHANVPGSEMAKGNKDGSVFNTYEADQKEKEVCRNYARLGNCKFGQRCKFLHVDEPATKKGKSTDDIKCYACGQKGHRIQDCKEPCSFCGETGHGEKHCKIRAKAIEAYKKQGNSNAAYTTNDSSSSSAASSARVNESPWDSAHVIGELPNFTFTARDISSDAYAQDFEVIYEDRACKSLANDLHTPMSLFTLDGEPIVVLAKASFEGAF